MQVREAGHRVQVGHDDAADDGPPEDEAVAAHLHPLLHLRALPRVGLVPADLLGGDVLRRPQDARHLPGVASHAEAGRDDPERHPHEASARLVEERQCVGRR